MTAIVVQELLLGPLGPKLITGIGDPSSGNGVSAAVSTLFQRNDAAQFWLKTSTEDTGWIELDISFGLNYVCGISSGFTGDGFDGAVTLGAGVTTLARDMFYTTLVVPSGAILDLANFVAHAQTSIVVDAGGVIRNNGNDAAAGVPGAATPAGSLAATIAGAATSASGTGTSNSPDGFTGSGGEGGGGSAMGGGAGGNVNVVNPAFGSMRALPFAAIGQVSNFNQVTGGASGGGGGHDGVGSGGGGGAGAGLVILLSPLICNSGIISAIGGAGGSVVAAQGGGGGGGGGGIVVLGTNSFFGGAPDVSGGGAGTGGGGAGTDGSPGNVGQVMMLGLYL